MFQHQAATQTKWNTAQNAVYVLSNFFATAHHTFMLLHVLNVVNALAKCKGTVPPDHHQKCLQWYNSSKEKSGSKKKGSDDNTITVSDFQSNAVFTLQSSKKPSCQMTIQTSLECTCQSDICHTKNAILEMANFFHCENIPDRVVESTRPLMQQSRLRSM